MNQSQRGSKMSRVPVDHSRRTRTKKVANFKSITILHHFITCTRGRFMLQLDQAPTAYSRACTWARWQAGTHDQKRRNHTFCCGRGLRVLMKWVSLIAGTLVSGAFCVYAHMPNSSQTPPSRPAALWRRFGATTPGSSRPQCSGSGVVE